VAVQGFVLASNESVRVWSLSWVDLSADVEVRGGRIRGIYLSDPVSSERSVGGGGPITDAEIVRRAGMVADAAGGESVEGLRARVISGRRQRWYALGVRRDYHSHDVVWTRSTAGFLWDREDVRVSLFAGDLSFRSFRDWRTVREWVPCAPRVTADAAGRTVKSSVRHIVRAMSRVFPHFRENPDYKSSIKALRGPVIVHPNRCISEESWGGRPTPTEPRLAYIIQLEFRFRDKESSKEKLEFAPWEVWIDAETATIIGGLY